MSQSGDDHGDGNACRDPTTETPERPRYVRMRPERPVKQEQPPAPNKGRDNEKPEGGRRQGDDGEGRRHHRPQPTDSMARTTARACTRRHQRLNRITVESSLDICGSLLAARPLRTVASRPGTSHGTEGS